MHEIRQQIQGFMSDVTDYHNLDDVTTNGRFYKIAYKNDIRIYPSVTTIIGQTVAKGRGFRRWLGDARSWDDAQKYTDERAELGTNVHAHCEHLANGQELSTEDWSREEIRKTLGFKKFIENEQPNEIVATETLVFSDHFGYAGTADLVLVSEGGESMLVDIKTSKRVYRAHKIQLSMYKDGLAEFGIDVDKIAVLRLKNEGYSLKEIDYDEAETVGTMLLYESAGRDRPKFQSELPGQISVDIQKTPSIDKSDKPQESGKTLV